MSDINRGAGLPGGLANLGDPVRLIDLDGTCLGRMIMAEALKLAADQNADLFVTDPTTSPPLVRIVILRKLADLAKAEIQRTSEST